MSKTLDMILAIDKRIEDFNKSRGILLKGLAGEICHYKVGQVTKAKGYVHRGKLCEITDIHCVESYSDGYVWRVRGIVLKADGTKSKNDCSWRQGHP